MSIDVKELIPPTVLATADKGQVIGFLIAQAWPGTFKAQVLRVWGETYGVTLAGADYRQVQLSGV